jgi:hypothetical protein
VRTARSEDEGGAAGPPPGARAPATEHAAARRATEALGLRSSQSSVRSVPLRPPPAAAAPRGVPFLRPNLRPKPRAVPIRTGAVR